MMTVRIEIDLERRCKRCKRKGATASGYCLECITKMIKEGKFDELLDHTLEKNRSKGR